MRQVLPMPSLGMEPALNPMNAIKVGVCDVCNQPAERVATRCPQPTSVHITNSHLDAAMKQKTSQTLFAYWNDVRGDRVAPRRFEIEPARIASILPETFILERFDTDKYVYRLAGTKLCEQFGSEFRGTSFLDGWQDDDRKTLLRCLGMDCLQGGVLVMDVEAGPLDQSSPRAEFEVTLMPLVHTSATVSRYLGSMSAIQPPAWLGTDRLVTRKLMAHTVIWPDGRPHAVADRSCNQAPLLSNLAGARLVKSERRTFRVLDGGLANIPSDDL